ncbi:Utp14 protein-domain-containing protein, partial [Bombardia bombarda]
MPGRQAHGRSLLPNADSGGAKKQKNIKKSRNHSNAKVLDAFALAEAQVPAGRTKGIRTRDLEEEPEERPQKRGRDGDDDDDDDEDDGDDDNADEDAPAKKRARKNDDEFDGFSGSGSDSEEWHVGVGSDDEDSDIDSDEAFGESDDEYAFSSKKKKANKGGEDESDEDDSDAESLGSDAIDLATALDQFEEDESDEVEGEESGDEPSDESMDSGDDEDEEDPSKLDALQNIIAGFGGDDEDDDDDAGLKPKSKLSLSDLGLFGVKDPHIKKSLKLMNKEGKATKPGSSKKLAVPLPKRKQDQLLRSAAYEKTSETLERWIDTVKHNRRADHLVFPLAQNAQDKGLDNGELLPITQKAAGTELEQTILAIMEESGLGPSSKPEKEIQPDGTPEQAGLSQAELKELQRQKRRERELHSREQARAKRIKKIKSKAFRRIHRKEAFHDEQAAHEALAQAGEIDSDEERDAQDRRRALERVGTKHRESKWAKLGKKAGRAVWDEDFRTGLTEMAQKKDELRRRVEGRKKGSDDDDDSDEDSDASMDSRGGDAFDEKRKLREELNRAAAYEDDEPRSALMQMKFMQRGEELRKKENDELVEQIRRDLDSDNEEEANDLADTDIGRRQFGMGKPTTATKTPKNPFLIKDKNGEVMEQPASTKKAAAKQIAVAAAAETKAPPEPEPTLAAPGAAGAWSRAAPEGRKSKKATRGGRVDELDLSNAAMLATKPSKRTSKASEGNKATITTADVEESEDEDTIHLPIAIRDQELIKRAFAGEDIVGEFEREKAELEEEEGDKEVDNTLPGWGNWVGDGVSARDKNRHQGRFMTKVEGIKKKDRQDFKLKRVIINEKRTKKNDKYLASNLPFPFESQQQYERSLRLPVGPEWTTKETFQDATKPRVIIKQGIIAPMTKPM